MTEFHKIEIILLICYPTLVGPVEDRFSAVTLLDNAEDAHKARLLLVTRDMLCLSTKNNSAVTTLLTKDRPVLWPH
jgi:hypothetical protein